MDLELPKNQDNPAQDGISNDSQSNADSSAEPPNTRAADLNTDEASSQLTDTATGFDFSGGHSSRKLKTVDYIGELFWDRYHMESLIGKGGMGSVYKARLAALNKTVAVKILHASLAEDEGARRRFEREARATSSLNHNNLATVSDFGIGPDGSPYFVMEYVSGDPLSAIIAKVGVVSPDRLVHLFLQVAAAINHAHNRGVIHRDIKPSNIIVSKTDDGNDQVKVVDFGIAKVLNEQPDGIQSQTQTGEILGSPLYMSPEQCTGNSLDTRSDIYSIGCVMYEALTGKPPLAGDNTVQTILKHVNESPQSIKSSSPSLSLPAGLEDVVMHCLEKNPDDRYQTISTLAEDLTSIRNGERPTNLSGTSIFNRAKKKPGLTADRFKVSVVVFSCLVIGIGGVTFTQLSHRAPEVPVPATVSQPQRPDSYDGRTLSQWTSAIEADPTNPNNYLGRGQLHDNRDERTNAIEDFSKAIELNPNFYDAYIRRSYVYTMLAQYDKAHADAELVVKKRPQDSDSYMARAFASQAQEDNQAAVQDLDKAIEISKAKLDYLQGANPGADHAANKAELVQTLKNSIAYTYYCKSRALLGLGRTKAALAAINEAISIDAATSYRSQRALVYAHLQEFDKALEDALISVRAPDARGVEWDYLAYIYTALGRDKEATEALNEGFALETFPARGYRFKAEIYRAAGKLEQAIQAYSASTSLEAYAPGYRGRARAYIASNQFHSAEEDLVKANKIVSGNPLTLSFLARVQDQNGKTNEADKNITAAFQKKGIPPMVYANRAAIAMHRGQLTIALNDLNTALAADLYIKEAHELRSRVYDKLGKSEWMQQDRDAASKLTPFIEF